MAQILKISSAYSPPPPEGFISPMTWGVEANVIERFAGAGILGTDTAPMIVVWMLAYFATGAFVGFLPGCWASVAA